MSGGKKHGHGSSGGGERFRPERARRGRVEKVWRSVRWAESFPDESLTMNAVDLTPTFALRKLAVLFDNGKVAECAALVRRLTAITLDAILSQLPIDILHDALPASLPVLEAIYVKVHQSSPGHLPTDLLRTDSLIQRLVALFAKQSPAWPANHSQPAGGSGGEEKNCNLHVPCCRSILRVVMATEPNFRRTVAQRKRALDRCLRKMGRHGLVGSAGGQLMGLHEALRVEFEREVAQFRAALHKLEELHLAGSKHGHHDRNVTSGHAPSEASHQRLMQVTRSDVQERIIKNKTLLNVVEPAAHNLHLARLLRTLRARIEYDKLLLFHDTELRKMGASSSSRRLAAVAESHTTSPHVPPSDANSGEEEEGGVVEGDADYLSVTSTLSVMKRMKVVSLNGLVPLKVKAGVLPASSGRVRNRLLGMQTTHTGSRGHRKEAGIQTTPIMESRADCPDGYNMSRRSPGVSANGQVRSMNMMSDLDSHNQGPAPSTTMLEQEILYLRQELSAARDQIRRLQDQEKQLRERLSDQVHQQFQLGNQQFEDLALGTQRPAELIRRYGDLYLDGRVDALDALDRLTPLNDLDVLKVKILFSVVVLAFKATQQRVGELRGRLRHLLGLPIPSPHHCSDTPHQHPKGTPDSSTTSASREPQTPAATLMEQQITDYLCKTSDTFDVAEIVFDVSQQIYATLYDYPCLKACAGLLEYVSQCVRIAWGLCVQRAPYSLAYETHTFDSRVHTRFHTSDPDSDQIKSFLWPPLVDSDGECVSRGVVIT
ncbi:hypothetical protein BaRGS_00014061 [Batillaria attramentaria]|uniref:Mitochondria-eating protein n=1 Tax=Batillaria attramentaria TaxID=370345 RepID=A0ABD0L537_9CAEN